MMPRGPRAVKRLFALATTASIGVLTCDPSSPPEPSDVLKRVDEALYDAKRAGKNRVAVYDVPCE